MGESDFCHVCGWPAGQLLGQACEACGTPPGGGPLGRDADDDCALRGPEPGDYPHFEGAFLAWQKRDWTQMVSQCLAALNIEEAQMSKFPVGPGWAFTCDSAVVYLHVHLKREELAVESPVVMVPERKRIPMMRTLLEMNDHSLGSSRFCLRGDRVVLRFADRITNVSPPKMADVIREVAILADRYDELLSVTFSAPQIGWDAQVDSMDWSYLGKSRRLENVVLRPRDEPRKGDPAGLARPAAKRRAASAPGGSVAPAAGDADAQRDLCRLLRESLELAQKGDLDRESHVLLQRATIYRAVAEFGDRCAGPVGELLRSGRGIVGELLGAPGSGLAPCDVDPRSMDQAFESLVAANGCSEERGTAQVSRFRSAGEAKRHILQYQSLLEQGPHDTRFRHFVLIGALQELLARARLSKRARQELSAALDEACAAPACDASTERMLTSLRGIVT